MVRVQWIAAAMFIAACAERPVSDGIWDFTAELGEPIVTATGLQYEDVRLGNGPAAAPGLQASVHYAGWLVDGTMFDTSRNAGRGPFSFQVGAGQVIEGWDEGVAGMRIGGVRRLIIPSELGYGAAGAGGDIPPNATLIFTVELLDVTSN